jgi:16S rRNA (guanine(527)-N(7))-methyltransferase RsmG
MWATEAVERDPRRALAALAGVWNVPCEGHQIDDLLRYADLLLRWNDHINLTGAGSVAALIISHFPDAFALASRLDHAERLIDVGSGGGLPALPLALLRPVLEIELSEPVAKKGAFLRTAIRELALSGRVRLEPRRGEVLADEGATFDVAVSRATFAPAAWLALGRRLVRPGGRIFALTTPRALPGEGAAPAQARETDRRRTHIYDDGRRAMLEIFLPPPSGQ